MLFEVLFIDGDIYYINYYENSLEFKAIKLKLTKQEFEKWKSNKYER